MITISTQPQSQIVRLGGNASLTVTASHSDPLANLYYQWYKNDKVIQNENAYVINISGVEQSDSDVYSCVISSDVDTSTIKTAYAAVASSILDYIELNIKIMILGMTKSGGYNFDWRTVNQPDEALGGFPRAVIVSPGENCIDLLTGQDAQSYANDVLFGIQIKGQQDWNDNANFMIRSSLRLALDDLKRLFGNNTSINGTCEVAMYKSSQVININQNDIQRPSHLNTSWLVRYTQDRLDPLTVSSS
jgi:hypothetical protein